MDGNIVEAEVENLTRQGVARNIGLAATLQAAQLIDKVKGTQDANTLKRRRKQSSAGPAQDVPKVVQLGATGYQYKLRHDTTALNELMMACCSAILPDVYLQEDLIAHMEAWGNLLKQFPSILRLGGDYIGPWLTRKHLLGLLSSLPKVRWEDVSRDTLASWSVDMGQYLSTAPTDWTVADLHTELLVEPVYITMWTCLLKEVEKLGSRGLHACRCRQGALMTTLKAYKKQHQVPPCPFVLVSRLLAADNMFWWHRQRRAAKLAYIEAGPNVHSCALGSVTTSQLGRSSHRQQQSMAH